MVPADSLAVPGPAAARGDTRQVPGFRVPGRLRQTIHCAANHERFLTASRRVALRHISHSPLFNPYPVTHACGLACSAFARHAAESGVSPPTGTEMFHFPAFLRTLYGDSDTGSTTSSCWVSPFRKSSDPRSVDNSRGISQPPTSFIGSRAKAPTCALRHLQTQQKPKNIAQEHAT